MIGPTLADYANDPTLLERRVVALWDDCGRAAVGAGKVWYPSGRRVCRSIARESGRPFAVVCAVVAVLSPMTRWAGNIEAAIAIIDGRDSGIPLEASKVKARAILALPDGATLGAYVGGPKVRAFFATLLGDHVRAARLLGIDRTDLANVVLDTWMVRALLDDMGADYKIGGNGGGGMTSRRYRLISATISATCERMGIAPSIWQAAAWCDWRGEDYGAALATVRRARRQAK